MPSILCMKPFAGEAKRVSAPFRRVPPLRPSPPTTLRIRSNTGEHYLSHNHPPCQGRPRTGCGQKCRAGRVHVVMDGLHDAGPPNKPPAMPCDAVLPFGIGTCKRSWNLHFRDFPSMPPMLPCRSKAEGHLHSQFFQKSSLLRAWCGSAEAFTQFLQAAQKAVPA